MANRYSRIWYETFSDSLSPDTTRKEVDFVARHLPLGSFPTILDVCCGSGRHACALAERGYEVLGVDRNEEALARARAATPKARFARCDMRSLNALRRPFHAVLNLWHSFGYFDDGTNLEVLRQVRDVLCPNGRAIFDLYNAEYFADRPSEETVVRHGRRIHIRRSWDGARQRVDQEYEDGEREAFEWRLYTPVEFRDRCVSAGLEPVVACAWFDESAPPSAEHARMQFVLERAP